MSGTEPAEPSRDNTDEHDEHDQRHEHLSTHQARRAFLITVAAILALLAAGFGGWLLGRPDHPGTDSVDAGFARDMSSHHAQAVEMSLIIRAKNAKSDVQTLAYDITTTQENQRGQMMGWLNHWGLPLAVSGERMDWMKRTGHNHGGMAAGQMLLPDGRMPGMASQQQMQQLRTATGTAAEILYLQLMIVHHRAGVDMAKAAVASAGEPETVRLARTMVEGQQGEINLMTSMLEQRGATPWTQQN